MVKKTTKEFMKAMSAYLDTLSSEQLDRFANIVAINSVKEKRKRKVKHG